MVDGTFHRWPQLCRGFAFAGAWLLTCLTVSPATAQVLRAARAQSGYERLVAELGPNMPTGSTVKVGMVEANSDPSWPGTAGSLPNYQLNLVSPDFAGKEVTLRSRPGEPSFHATIVGSYFFGNSQSLAPGVKDIEFYLAEDFVGEEYLHYRESTYPETTPARVFNHSWIDFGDANSLARIDYTADFANVLHVVGVNNVNNGGPAPLLASAYNTLAVGLSSGQHALGTVPVSDPIGTIELYNLPNRQRPDLVVDESFTSYATPLVAGASTLLVETAHNQAALSEGSRPLPGDVGYYITNGETTEVIRSILRAGADRAVWSDYRGPDFQSANGLDIRYGAGELDLYQSYHILTAGEQPSAELSGPAISRLGFDYGKEFELVGQATYPFATTGYQENLAVSLSWNAQIGASRTGSFNRTSANLANFELELQKVSQDGARQIVASSLSAYDNSENLYLSQLEPNTNYELVVRRADDLEINWNYGLAWNRQVLNPLAGDIDLDGFVNIFDFIQLRNHFGKLGSRSTGDLDGDGIVSLPDFILLRNGFGDSIRQTTSAKSGNLIDLIAPGGGTLRVPAVPEPASLELVMSLMAGVTFCCLWRGTPRLVGKAAAA